jgi:hypothetical protein
MSATSACPPVMLTNVRSVSYVLMYDLTYPDPVAQMQNYAINNHLTPFISMQNHYNAIYREEEREMIPTLKVCPPSFSLVTHECS